MNAGLEYLDYWKLERPPFESQADPEFYYESKTHSEALARMLYFVGDRGMGIGVLTGEIGSGKTLITRLLRRKTNSERYQIAYLPTASYAFREIVAEVNRQVQPGPDTAGGDAGKYQTVRRFEELLQVRIAALGRHLLIILDEAQLLDPECIEELKCLTNLNGERHLLSILLTGQPELKEQLKALPQVYQRVGMYYHLGHLSARETADYIAHRMRAAGAPNPMRFDHRCTEMVHSFSGGCPRQINRVCKLVVDRACLKQKEMVDRDDVSMIIEDIVKQFGIDF